MKNVFQSKYLTSENEIEGFFMEDGYEHFDCGQGYLQDEADIVVQIGEKFYKVNITAEIGSEKQDRGDRLYFVERIETVQWSEMTQEDVFLQVLAELTAVVDSTEAKYLKASKDLSDHIKNNQPK